MVICEALACSCEHFVKQRFSSSPSSWLKVTSMAVALCSVLIVTRTVNLRTIVPKLWLCTSHKYIIFSVPSFSHVHFNILQSCLRLFLCRELFIFGIKHTILNETRCPFVLEQREQIWTCQFLKKKLESISTFCRTLAAPFRSRIHSSTWDGYVGGHLLQGPPHLSSISLAKQVGPLLLGAQGSSPRNGLGPLLCNMSDKWYILRPFRLFFGHEHGRSLLLVRTACGTMRKKNQNSNKLEKNSRPFDDL